MRVHACLLLFATLSFTWTDAILADPMVFTLEDGTDIVLKDDGSWRYEGQGYAEPPKKDYTVVLDDGRELRINTDWTWRFLEEGEEIAKPISNLQNAHARATAEGIDVLEARAAASKKALGRVARKLKSSSRKKVAHSRITECMHSLGIEAETDEQFTQGKGWDVAAEYRLDSRQITAILECATDTSKAEGK
jgi:hypothetical protein